MRVGNRGRALLGSAPFFAFARQRRTLARRLSGRRVPAKAAGLSSNLGREVDAIHSPRPLFPLTQAAQRSAGKLECVLRHHIRYFECKLSFSVCSHSVRPLRRRPKSQTSVGDLASRTGKVQVRILR